MKWVKSFCHRRPIVPSAGKHVQRRPIVTLAMHTLHTHVLHHDWKRKRCKSRWKGEHGGCGHGRGQNYTGTRMVAKSGLCAALSNNVFDNGHRQLWIRCKLRGRNLYSSSVQTTDKTSGMSYRTRSRSRLPNQSIFRKSWQDMPFENRWFTPDNRKYNRPTFKASHPGSCSRTWSRPWCTYATCNFG
jgi:hypothetical protein